MTPTVRLAVAGLLTGAYLVGCGDRVPDIDGDPLCPSVPRSEATWTTSSNFAPTHTDRLLEWTAQLASPERRGRRAGTADARAAASWIAAEMQRLGLTAPFSADDASPHFCQAYTVLGEYDHNIVGHLFQHPDRPTVLIGAHYDGQGMHPAGLPFPSADDNASGVAALLEIAFQVTRQADTSWPNLVFVAFGGEEIGLLGSTKFANAPSKPLEEFDLMINLDMVGRPLGKEPKIGFWTLGEDSEKLARLLTEASEPSDVLTVRFPDAAPRSDSSVFSPSMPTVYLSTGTHADQHERTATLARLDPSQIDRAARLVLALLQQTD